VAVGGFVSGGGEIARTPEADLELEVLDRAEAGRGVVALGFVVLRPARLQLGAALVERARVIDAQGALGMRQAGSA